MIAQTYTNWDQIILDDESTDDTAAVVRAWSDSRIRYERQRHAGIAALAVTYNRALQATRGELVAILEGDDFWAPEKLEVLIPKFRDPDVVLAYGRTSIVIGTRLTGRSIPDKAFVRKYGSEALFNRPRWTAAVAMLETGLPFTFPCSVVIRRSALDAIGGFQAAKDLGAVDYPTFLMLTTLGHFEYVDSTVAYWRRHSGSGSWSTHQQAMQAAVDFGRRFMNDHPADLALGQGRVAAMERIWRRRLQRAAFNGGRYLLLQGRWRDARDRFAQAVRSQHPPILVGGLVGYVASLARTDIEGLMALVGRVSFGAERAPKR